MFQTRFFALPRPIAFFSAIALSFTLAALAPRTARAQGTIYSSSTTFAQHNQTITVSATIPNNLAAPGSFQSQDYFAYNYAGAATQAAGGTYSPSGGGAYPAGWRFSDGLTETGSGTIYGQSKTASVSFTGQTTNYTTATNTWIKGPTESGGLWNVKAGSSSFLGGFTSAANNQTGSVTINLGADYSAWGTLIGTQTGATLGVTIAGYAAVGNTLGNSIFSYELDNITHNTASPTFTGWSGSSTTKVNTIVITGLQNKSSAGAMPAAYSAYPAGSYLALDQTRVGNAEVPEPASLLLALAGTSFLALARRRHAR